MLSSNHILILSDIHLGSPNCRAENVLKVLDKEDFNILILNGDIIDSDHLGRLNKSHWKVLSKFRKLSKHKRVLYIKGNHDFIISETVSDLLGLELIENIVIEYQNKKFYFTHGAEFDSFIARRPLLTDLACYIYYSLQRLDWTRGKISNWVKHSTKNYMKNAIALREAAIRYRTHHNYYAICVGHSHRAEGHLQFLNSGCFTESRCSYGVLTKEGELEMRYI